MCRASVSLQRDTLGRYFRSIRGTIRADSSGRRCAHIRACDMFSGTLSVRKPKHVRDRVIHRAHANTTIQRVLQLVKEQLGLRFSIGVPNRLSAYLLFRASAIEFRPNIGNLRIQPSIHAGESILSFLYGRQSNANQKRQLGDAPEPADATTSVSH